MMRRSYFLVFATSYSGFKLGGGGFKNSPSPYYENPDKKSPGTKIKFHPARGRGQIRGWLIKVFVEFQHKIALVVDLAERAVSGNLALRHHLSSGKYGCDQRPFIHD